MVLLVPRYPLLPLRQLNHHGTLAHFSAPYHHTGPADIHSGQHHVRSSKNVFKKTSSPKQEEDDVDKALKREQLLPKYPDLFALDFFIDTSSTCTGLSRDSYRRCTGYSAHLHLQSDLLCQSYCQGVLD